MNDKIKEIAQKAGIGILYDYSEPDDLDGFSTHAGVCDLKDINKFAELIIQECAKIADDGFGSAHFGSGIRGYMLKEHFGVKE
jgi:hypothetical protein